MLFLKVYFSLPHFLSQGNIIMILRFIRWKWYPLWQKIDWYDTKHSVSGVCYKSVILQIINNTTRNKVKWIKDGGWVIARFYMIT